MATTMADFLNPTAKKKLMSSAPPFNGQIPDKISLLGQSSAKNSANVAPAKEVALKANKTPMTMADFLKPAVAEAAADPKTETKHILTREQVIDNINAMEAQGAKPEEIQEYLDDLKARDQQWQADEAKKATAVPTAAKEEKTPGFIQSVAQNIAKPFLKTAATVKGFTDSTGALLNYLSGNKEAAKIGLEEADKGIDAGYLGKAEPVKSTKEAIGTGLELASNVIGGGAVKNVAGATIKGQILRGVGKGMAGGAATGFTGGMGRDLQEGETVENSVAQGVMDGIVTSVLGGVVGAAGPIIGKTARIAGKVKKGDTGSQIVAKAAREIEGTGINTGISKLPNRIAQQVAEKAEKGVAMAKEVPAMQQATKAGIDDAWLGMVKNASKKDIDHMVEMYKIAENSQGKLVKDRPVAIAGKSIIDRVNFLKGKRTSIGQAIGNAKKNLPDNQVDITGVVDDFAAKLDGMGVTVGKGGKLNFSNSELNTPSSTGEKQLLEFIWNQIKPDENGVAFRTPKQLDLIRGRIKNELSMKPKNIGETTYAETLAKGLRVNLKSEIKNVSKAYEKLSNQYSEITRSLQDFYGLIQKEWTGKSGDLLDLRAGEVMSRILGNAAAKPQYVLEQLEEVAQKAGRDKLDDPLYQIAFSDWLEDAFGSMQPRSLGGQVERATMNAQEKINLASSLKDPLATAGKVIDKFSAGQKQKQQAMKALLDYYSKIKK
jgi:hypothetical protein